jgi:hypothetical protein
VAGTVDTNLGRMRDENLATEKSHMAVMLSPRSKRMRSVTEKDCRVSPDDGHFNEKATDQLMSDLARRLAARIPNKNS